MSNNNQRLVYTKAIKDGKVKATAVGVGESITGTLIGFKQNNYGTSNVLVEVNGSEVEILSAGNLKFLEQDINDGKANVQVGDFVILTRTPDGKSKKGYAVTKFSITSENSATDETPTQPQQKQTVQEKLADIRAKRTSV